MNNYLEHHFKAYEEQVLEYKEEPLGPIRRAFYAGAAAFFATVMSEVTDQGRAVNIFKELNSELVRFTEEMRKDLENGINRR